MKFYILRKHDVIERALYAKEVWCITYTISRVGVIMKNRKNIVRVILMNCKNFGTKADWKFMKRKK